MTLEEKARESSINACLYTNMVISQPSYEQGYIAGAKENEERLEQAIKLLKFWVNDFYDNFNHSNKYEERHNALVETEQFLEKVK